MKNLLFVIACLATFMFSSCKTDYVWDCHADNVATLIANHKDINETVNTEAEANVWCTEVAIPFEEETVLEVQGCSCTRREK